MEEEEQEKVEEEEHGGSSSDSGESYTGVVKRKQPSRRRKPRFVSRPAFLDPKSHSHSVIQLDNV